MEEQKVNALMGRISRKILPARRAEVKQKMRAAEDSAYAEIVSMRLRSKGVTVVLAVFLGWLGADRFYAGSVVTGIFKLLLALICGTLEALRYTLLPLPLLGLAGLIVGGVLALWIIIDWFVSFRAGLRRNYVKIALCLEKHAAVNEESADETSDKDGREDIMAAVDAGIVRYAVQSLGAEVRLKPHVIGGNRIGSYVFFYMYVRQIDSHVSCSFGAFYSGRVFASINLGRATDIGRADAMVKQFNSGRPYRAYFSNDNVMIDFRAAYCGTDGMCAAFNSVVRQINECFDSADFIRLFRSM